MQVLAAIGLVASIAMVIVLLIAVFPLAWEGKAHACPALETMLARQTDQWTPRPGAGGPALAMTPNAEVPAWFRCTVAYWRRLDATPPTRQDLARLAGNADPALAACLVGAGLLLGLIGLGVWMRRHRAVVPDPEDAFSILGIEPATVVQPVAAPPVDLTKAIVGAAAWKAMRAHAWDADYQRAVETLRLRYQLVGNQMLLPNTLREVMTRSGSTFREAVLRVAANDGIGRLRQAGAGPRIKA